MGDASMTVEEKRKQIRQKLSTEIDVIDIHSERRLGQLMDVSTQGLMMLSDVPISTNSIFELLIQLPVEIEGCKEIRLGVESLWTRESNDGTQHWTGFHVISIDDQDLHCIEAVMRHF